MVKSHAGNAGDSFKTNGDIKVEIGSCNWFVIYHIVLRINFQKVVTKVRQETNS